MIDRLWQDVRDAGRSLVRGRGVTLIAILSIAIGIAANATVFSMVQAVEFPRLIYPDASRLIVLESNNHARGLSGMPVSAPDAIDIASSSRSIETSALTADQSSVLRDGTVPIRIAGRRVEPTFFEVLGLPPLLGRTLRHDDGADVIVLANALWRSNFGEDRSIVGRTIPVDGRPLTVVGVMPPGFDEDADFWVPLTDRTAFARDDRQLTLFARLSSDVSLREATTEIESISRRLAEDHPSTNHDWTTTPVQLSRLHGRDSRGVFILLQCAVLFVLLIACANIANLLLARGTKRHHEMAIRVSLGASRGQLISALLAESLMLSMAGGLLGLLAAMWCIDFARALGGFPDVIRPSLNPGVVAFAAVLALLTGVASGIIPALRASAVSPAPALREDDTRAVGSRGWLQAGLVAFQMACAVVLTTAASLMVQTLLNRQQVDLGFEPRGAIRADVALSGARYQDYAAVRAAVDSLLDRLASSPNVAAAGIQTFALPTGAGAQRQMTVPARDYAGLAPGVRRGVHAVSPGYFDALGVPLIAGRSLQESDREGSAPVAVINEELARHLWPDRNPVGELLKLGEAGEQAPVVTVVGVVGTIRRSGMHDVPVALAYVPFAQHPASTFSIVVRGRGDLQAVERQLHTAVNAVDPALFPEGVRSLEADLAQFLAPIRMIGTMLGAFGLAGLLLAALGVFGTMSYFVSQRERELAVRTALGASPRDIVVLVFGGALRITAIGVAAGVLLAFGAAQALRGLLFGVSPSDPATFAGVIGTLILAALVACYGPARAATSADPIALLRR